MDQDGGSVRSSPARAEQPGHAPDKHSVLVVGECLVDLAPAPVPPTVPDKDAAERRPLALFAAMPGGGPANVAIGLARLGTRCLFAGRFSRDGFGPWLKHNLASNGVELELSAQASEPATLAVVTIDERGGASYTFYGPETADWQWHVEDLPGARGTSLSGLGVAAVHTGSLATVFQPGASAISQWLVDVYRKGETLISFDPNVRKGLVADDQAYREQIEGIASHAHIIKASEEDLDLIYPGEHAADVADRLLEAGARLVVVTQGERGATALHHSGLVASSPPPKVDVVDTIGAGDAFTSGLLAYFSRESLLSPSAVSGLNTGDLENALAQAVAASAFTCTRAGSDPPGTAELASFMAQRQKPISH